MPNKIKNLEEMLDKDNVAPLNVFGNISDE